MYGYGITCVLSSYCYKIIGFYFYHHDSSLWLELNFLARSLCYQVVGRMKKASYQPLWENESLRLREYQIMIKIKYWMSFALKNVMKVHTLLKIFAKQWTYFAKMLYSSLKLYLFENMSEDIISMYFPPKFEFLNSDSAWKKLLKWLLLNSKRFGNP